VERDLAIDLVEELTSGRLSGVAIDSREVQPGGCFFALPGARTDGHAFLRQAAERGGSIAIVKEAYDGPSFGLRLHRVGDTLLALQECGAARFRRLTGVVVGITGSYGKTTTKHFAQQLLSTHCRSWVTPRNQNSQSGLPLSLLNLTGDPEVVLLEMAMTTRGQIARLVDLFPPHLAVIIGVALAHAENFASLGEIATAKAEIFSSRRLSKAILSADLPPSVMGACPVPFETFSCVDSQATYFARGKTTVRVFEKGEPVGPMIWHLPAVHHRHNFLAAAAIARQLKQDWRSILAAAASFSPASQRYEVRKLGALTVIDDCYNANETTVCAALDHLPAPGAGGRRIAVLGLLPELGVHSEASHLRVARHAMKRADLLLCIGEKTRPMADSWLRAGRPATWYADVADAVRGLLRLVRPGDVVLVKGGRTARLERVIQRLKPL
jgi:UDP-N-acetylmuramoyl-tripeptide--D-alanyl-D-alanine ligase